MGSGVKYSTEFRSAAVQEVLVSSAPIREIAEGVGVKPATLRVWINRAKREGVVAKERDESALETENRKLRKELQELSEENRFLKKAAAFFAADQQPKSGSR